MTSSYPMMSVRHRHDGISVGGDTVYALDSPPSRHRAVHERRSRATPTGTVLDRLGVGSV